MEPSSDFSWRIDQENQKDAPKYAPVCQLSFLEFDCLLASRFRMELYQENFMEVFVLGASE
ncbi:uncharacterized protein PHALS_04347 [Plasmopara halstedii]|uniref:Uncharacterized protein n=1 Tax=Plasmopara halstedii TaxID=4781 RepID=A0A0N7L7M3_PLAHL|nr:uncharacterized protein PHALS_04347 [Plasmopara halstedii]CEG47475.1 hypothetical protein PHALS_04347 [Plasmopara halstedii]|eukprot:XP_024583844.1 hypothetical protein PHALS_04347 [Plasmopara halstedii]